MKIALLTTDSREHFHHYERPLPYFGTAPQGLLEGFSLLPEIEVHVISCLQQAAPNPEKLAPNVWYHGLVVPKIGWLRTGYQGCIRAVRRTLQRIRPDIVHGQGTERDCALNAVFSGFPNVLTIHGNMRLIAEVNRANPFSFEWFAARLEAFTVPRTDGVVCITEYTRRAVARDGVRTWVLPNAVDHLLFAATPTPPAVPTVVCIGHITVRKNQNAFIHALDRIVAEHPLRLICIGLAADNDPYAEQFHALRATRPWVEYVPWVDRPELREYLRNATILALPSLEDNCPMAVLEAMAGNVPVIAAKVGGLPDLIENGVTGLFCDPLDEASMSTAVRRLLSDSNLAKTLAEQARKKAWETYHPSVIAQRHVEIYRTVLSERG